MKKSLIKRARCRDPETNIYANRSGVLLHWILSAGVNVFSLRAAARQCGLSVGTVHTVCRQLIQNGVLVAEGVRTAKTFIVKNRKKLLKSWLSQYDVSRKCRMWMYQSGCKDRAEMLCRLKGIPACLALHTAAEAHGCANTNLETLELYITGDEMRKQIEKALDLEPQERGYQVLLIEPYYKDLIASSKVSSPLLTFLDLYNFPLRGIEQAEFLAERMPILREIY